MAAADSFSERRLRIFLCHSSADKETVRDLRSRLERDGFAPWLDEKELLPGQPWQEAIEDAVRASDVVLVCLSAGSVSKEGYLQREIKFALQIADEKPDDTIYIVPTRLEPVELPRRFREFQAANLYEAGGYEQLKRSLALRAAQIAAAPPLPSPEPHSIWLTTPKTETEKTVSTVPALAWAQTHIRVLAVTSLLIIGPGVFGGYSIYQKQSRQRAAAEKFFNQAESSWKALRLREAESLFSQAAAAEPTNPIILANYALSLNERGKEDQARVIAKRALDYASSLASHEREMVEAISYEVTANWAKAEELYSTLWERTNSPEHGLRLAHVQTYGGSPTKALETLQQSPLAGSDDARVLLEKAAALRFLGRFDEVRDILNRILTEHPGNDLVRAMALAEKCWADYNGRDVSDSLKTALDDCKQAADIFNDNEDALGQARTLTRHALIISDKDSSAPDFASAREMQKRAIEITHERGAIRDEAGGRQNLANILMEQTPPDPELARTEYERSQEMFRNLGDLAGVAGVENDQAVRLIDLCRFQDALNSARQARQNWNAVGSRYEAIALANQGSMESFLGDLTQAELDLKSALLMAEASKLSIDRDNWLITLGETYAAEGNLPRAEQCYKEGPCYDDRQPSAVRNLNVLADAAVSYAALLIDQKDFAGAERVAQNALAHATNEKDPDEESWARVVLANALLAQQKGAPLNRAKDAMMGLAAIKSKDCRVGVAAGLSLARIEGRSGNIDRQQEKLTEVLQKAHAMGLLGYELEATLDQAEADLRAGKSNSARDLAQQVVNQSGSRKFPLVKARASDLFNRAKVGGIAGN